MLTSRTVDITLPRPFPWQRQVQREARRFNCVAVGRRGGKSTMTHDLLIRPALESFPVAYFAPTYKLLSETWRGIKRIVQPVTRGSNATDHRIELITGGVIEMWTLEDENAGRSRKYKRVVVDEAGLVHDLGDRWNDAIRPTLADYEGDAFALGTPKGHNFFYQMYNWGQDSLMVDWASWQMPTMVNPLISPAEIEDMRRTMPSLVFDQEVLALFVREEGAVFRNIPACLHAPTDSVPYKHEGHELVMGVDWAQKVDFTCISVVCSTCRCEVAFDRFNQIGWDVQRGRLTALYDVWKPYTILAESNSIGGPNIEALVNEDLPVMGFETTASSKPQLIKSLVLAFERAEMQWLPDPVGKAELEAYEATVSPSTGRVSYSAPENAHDDSVIARALAFRAASMWQSV